jgi:membrane peptidoglycan carboxypeptidase
VGDNPSAWWDQTTPPAATGAPGGYLPSAPPGYTQPRPPTPETFFSAPGTSVPRSGVRGRSGRAGGPGGGGRWRPIDYPRQGRRGVWRWLPSWKLVTGLFLTGVITLTVAAVAIYAMIPIPSITAAALPETSIVLYSDGTQIGQFKKEQRTVVPLSQVPDHVQKAVVAIEDRTFYSNQGISPRGVVRAVWNNVRGGDVQGGSTITQQYVKNFTNNWDRSLQRKARELVISLKVAQQVPKDEILQDYLNKIYWGRDANGIQAAARTYFGKDVSKLTVSEGAFLAGIINSPANYDPTDGPKSAAAATLRWQETLDAMVEMQWLAPAEAQKIKAAGLPKVRKPAARSGFTNQQGYLMELVAREAQAKAGLSRDNLATGGYLIRTTFDKKMIAAGIKSVDEVLGARKSWPTGTEVGIASVRPGDGAIQAIYGGDDKDSFNAATQAGLQAGSTFKVFGLIAALEGNPGKPGAAPLSLRSRFSGRSPYELQDGKKVFNYGRGNGEQFGQIDLLDATAHSVNTVYAQLNERVDPAFTEQVAIQAGLPEDTPGLEANALNLLGSASPHILDLASAYATIAAGGRHAEPYAITQIGTVDKKRLIYKHEVRPVQVFDPGVMADTTYALRQVVQRGTGTYARALGRPAAGKTGTSSDNKSASFVGFTPQLATAVGLYRSIEKNGTWTEATLKGWGSFRGRELTGGSFPVRVWTDYMKAALAGTEVVPFPDPVYGGELVNPAPPSPTATPSPTAPPSPSDSPSQQPTVSPLPSWSDQPSPTGRPRPSRTLPPQPSIEPSGLPSISAAAVGGGG